VLNGDEIIAWARKQGFKSMFPASDLHVTVAYSKRPVDWDEIGDDFDRLRVAGGEREIKRLGNAVVLRFRSGELTKRWSAIRKAGAAWEYDSYQPHITLTYEGRGLDLSRIKPFVKPIELGPERFRQLDPKWRPQEEAKSVVVLTSRPAPKAPEKPATPPPKPIILFRRAS
jgi:hypothetical protein